MNATRIPSGDPVWETVMQLAAIAARPLARRFQPHVDQDDLQMIGVEHALNRHDKVAEFLKRDDPDEAKQGERAFITFLGRHMERKARAEKARVSGYQPEDEYFYRPTMIESLIKVWGTGDYDLAGQVLDPAELGGKRRTKVASEGNDLLAMMADVDSAIMRLDERTRDMLTLRFVDELTLARIGERYSLSPQRVEQITSRGIRRMVEHLGGRNPY
jgi:RNA polymerase sigma factor (sigma-70 family)